MPTVLSRVLIAALLLAAGAFAPAYAAKVLHRGNAAEPYSLDPHKATGGWENNIIGDMIVGLYTEDAGATPIFGAAESATTSDDGLTWTFKIRDHAWSDGVPVTADDFVFAFRRILDPKTAAEYASVLYPIKNALKVNKSELAVDQLGVRAIDAKTLVIELEDPAPFLPQLLTHYTTFPVPRHLVQKYGSDWVKPGKIAGNGPYVLAEWRPHDHVKLVKNPKFYDAANVKIDEVYFYPTDDDLAALKRFRAGELDEHERWPLTEHKWLAQNIPNEARSYTVLQVTYTSFNMTRPPFNDARVRRAVSLALDRKQIEEKVYYGVYGDVAASLLPPGTANVDPSSKVDYEGQPMEARQAEARKLLAAAGYGPNNPLRFTYNYMTNNDTKRAAVAMQAMWKQVGIEATITNTEPKVHYKLLQTKNFEAAQAAWIFDYNDAKNILYMFESSTVEFNYSGYNNPEFDALMARADQERDATARGKLLGQANALLNRDLPAAPNFFPYERKLVKSYVLNWVNNPRDINRTRWLDIGNKTTSVADAGGGEGAAAASEGGFWSWLASWFSGEAWQKWWNS